MKIEALEQQVVALKALLEAHDQGNLHDSTGSHEDDIWAEDDYARDQETQDQLRRLEGELISAKLQAAELANQAAMADQYERELKKSERNAAAIKKRADDLQKKLDAGGDADSWFS